MIIQLCIQDYLNYLKHETLQNFIGWIKSHMCEKNGFSEVFKNLARYRSENFK